MLVCTRWSWPTWRVWRSPTARTCSGRCTSSRIGIKIRAEVQQPAAIVRAATSVAARLVRREDQIGRVRPGFLADLLVVDGNPLEDINVLAQPGDHLQLVMKAGQMYRECLA